MVEQKAPAQPEQKAPGVLGRSQKGEAVSGPVSSNPPRGVNEAPSDQIADEPGAKALQEHVHKQVHEETKRGFRGSQVDPTPNENYTLKGVGSGKPTAETTVYTPKS